MAKKDSKKSVKMIRRGAIGFNVLLQMILLFVIVIAINVLSSQNYRQWDHTEAKKYSLSEQTLRYLTTLEEPVKVIIAFVRGSTISDDVKGLLEEYQYHSDGMLMVETFDPARDPNRATEIANKYNLLFDRNLVLIDANDRVRTVAEADMIQLNSGGKVEAFRGEDALTTALISVMDKAQRKLYVVGGKGELRKTRYGTTVDFLSKQLKQQNTEVEWTFLGDRQEVPEDASGVLIIAPKFDLTENEIKMLRTYWEEKTGSMIVWLDPAGETPKLNAFLRSYGIFPRDDRVMVSLSIPGVENRKQYDVPAFFIPGSPITESLAGVNTQFDRQSKSLKLYENDALLNEEKIKVTPLVIAGEGFWGESKYTEDVVAYDTTEDATNPIYLSASVEKGAVKDDRLEIDSSRMVVVSNCSFAEPSLMTRTNLSFILSSINWVMDREEFVGIPAKKTNNFKIDISQRDYRIVSWIVILGVPLVLFIIGLCVWAVRRN